MKKIIAVLAATMLVAACADSAETETSPGGGGTNC